MSRRLCHKEFIEKCIDLRGDNYDYSHVIYKNMKSKIKLFCKNKHEFHITPDNFLRGRGCYICAGKENMVNTLNDFIIKSNSIHNNKYRYDKFVYKNSQTKSIITCSIHGDFEQTPNTHLSGCGCKKCYHKSLSCDINSFIERSNIMYNNKYGYDKFVYINNQTKSIITCPIHGDFKQSSSVHLSGSGCKECMKERFRKPFEQFNKESIEIHGDKYSYDDIIYVDIKTHIILNCNIHGRFKITPDNHIHRKQGCPSCGKNISKPELEWLDKLGISNRQYRLNIDNKTFKFDGFDPDNNIIYEFYGDFWHGNPDIYDKEDINPITKEKFGKLYEKTMERESFLKSFGYKIISIWESDYKKYIKI
jgi:G:T-mismatch repair DNA endonuclease (very short patch repair protein)